MPNATDDPISNKWLTPCMEPFNLHTNKGRVENCSALYHSHITIKISFVVDFSSDEIQL